MNPVGSKEQREELRRHLGPTPASINARMFEPRCTAELRLALDGLDIAEEMAKALVEPVNDRHGHPKLRGCKACRNLWKKDKPEKHLDGCVLAEWDNWKKGKAL